jgi:hypothetical protein
VNHVTETCERGIKEVEKIQVPPPENKRQPISVTSQVNKRTPTVAVASVLAKPSSSIMIVIDGSVKHPLKPTFLVDSKAATAKAALANTRAKPPSGVVNTKAKPPPEAAKRSDKPRPFVF